MGIFCPLGPFSKLEKRNRFADFHAQPSGLHKGKRMSEAGKIVKDRIQKAKRNTDRKAKTEIKTEN